MSVAVESFRSGYDGRGTGQFVGQLPGHADPGRRLYEFFVRLVNLSLPSICDFGGVPSKCCEGRCNYTLGIKEHIIFPEIDYAKIVEVMGMDITIVTSARTDEECLALLEQLKMPFKKN